MIERIEAVALERSFGRARVLSRISTTFEAGQSILIVGPNGAGKSTLLNLLAGLDSPTAGELRYNGKPLDLSLRASIGVLGHDSRCYADLSATENLVLFARLGGVAFPSRAADEMVKTLDLTAAKERPARTYSRGMLQRLALGRALIHSPSVLLLDEPFTGLDRESIAALRTRLFAERERGTLMMLISHDFEAVDGLCDRVVGIARGRLHELGGHGQKSASDLASLYHGFGDGAS